jgi:hypothetical protein
MTSLALCTSNWYVLVVVFVGQMVSVCVGVCVCVCVCVCVAGHSVPVWVRKGGLTFPPAHQPILLVGPGTGCAPFRSVLHERTTIASHTQGMLWYVTKLASHASTTSRSCELKYYFIVLVV